MLGCAVAEGLACATCTEPLCTRCEQLLPWQIDLSNVLAETRRRLWPGLDELRGLDE